MIMPPKVLNLTCLLIISSLITRKWATNSPVLYENIKKEESSTLMKVDENPTNSSPELSKPKVVEHYEDYAKSTLNSAMSEEVLIKVMGSKPR